MLYILHNQDQPIEVKAWRASLGLSTIFTHFIYKSTSRRYSLLTHSQFIWTFTTAPHSLVPLVLLSSHEQQLAQNAAHCDAGDEAPLIF